MFFFLSKILLWFTFPLSWIMLCLVLAFILRKRRSFKPLLVLALIIFLLFSNPAIYLNTLEQWEGSNADFQLPIPERDEKVYDAIVVLGGYSSWNEMHKMVTFNYSSDRILEGVRLYQMGIGKRIILSGGSGLLLKQDEKESIWMKDYLVKLGVKADDIFIEGESRNTHENAAYTADLIRNRFNPGGKYLLITSAYHMNRAGACFKKPGLDFEYYRVGFQVDDDDFHAGTYILPSAVVLEAWQMLIKEWIGYSVYAIRGYL